MTAPKNDKARKVQGMSDRTEMLLLGIWTAINAVVLAAVVWR